MKKSIYFILLAAISIIGFSSIAQNNSIDFDGTNDRISVNSSATFNSANALTLEAWIYADTWKANVWEGTIIGKDQVNQSGYVLRCGDNGKLSFTVGVGNVTWVEVVSAPIMQTNAWYHIAGVMDNGTLIIYIDGVQVGTTTSNPIVNSTNPVYIGESAGFAGRVFDGKIDEVRIWNVARSQIEISNNMGVNLPDTTSNLLGYFKMDTIIGNDTTPNLMSSASNGLLQNFGSSILSGGYIIPILDIAVSNLTSPDLISAFKKDGKMGGVFKNVGNDTIKSFSVGYLLNSNSAVIDTVNKILLPGEEYKHVFSSLISKFSSTSTIQLFATLNGDSNTANDSITTTYKLPTTGSGLEIPIFTQEQHNFGAAGQTHLSSVILPENNVNVSKITMELSVACPSTGCDPWDQPAKISVLKNGLSYEIVRYITPYGKACGPWTVDVTDFKTLLRGYTEFSSYIQVWGSSGWLLNAKLIYEYNSVANGYQKLTPLWSTDNWVYGDPAVSYDLPAQTIKIDSNTNTTAMRMTISGHGQGNTNNAAEFSQFTHTVTANSTNVNSHTLWKNNCNANSCSNQFGTWQFARAGWCPGQAVEPYLVNLTSNAVAGQNLTVDYVLQNYTNLLRTGYNSNGHTEPHYKIHAYLIEKSNKYIDTVPFTDLAATEITEPSSPNYSATTPVKVMLKNYGSTAISSPTISLWVNGTITAVDNLTTSIPAGDSLEHTFTVQPNFISSNTYDLVVSLNAMNDEAATNDVITKTLEQTVGLVEKHIKDKLLIYPNPSQGNFTLSGLKLTGDVRLEIYNYSGQLLFVKQYVGSKKENLQVAASLKSGMYFIKVKDDAGTFYERLIIGK